MIFKPFVPYLNLKNKKAIQTLDYQSLYRFLVCPRRESNPHFKNRNLTCYPLHHEGYMYAKNAYRTNNNYSEIRSVLQVLF